MKKTVVTAIIGTAAFSFMLFGSAISAEQPKPQGKTESAASKTAAGPRQRFSFATNAAGTGLYTIAVGQSQVLAKRSNIDLVVQPASGPLTTPRLVSTKQAMIGLTSGKILADAHNGLGEFSGKKQPGLRVLQTGQITVFGLITHTGTGVKSISDLKGKKVTWNILTSDLSRNIGFLELKAYGLDGFKDVRMLKSESTATGIQDLAQGRTDAAACSFMGSKFEELATKVTPVALPFDHKKMDVIQREMSSVFPAFTRKTAVIPAGIPTVGSPEAFFANQDLPEDVAYQIVKTLLGSVEELKLIHRDFAEWSLDNAVKKIPVPYHPGAIRYYKEIGVWTAEMDQFQAQLLK